MAAREDSEHAEFELPPELAIIGRYPSTRKAHEAGLAILACGYHYWVYPSEGSYLLAVSSQNAAALQREVALAKSFNRYWPPASIELPTRKISLAPTALATLILIGAFIAQNAIGWVTELGMNSSLALWQNGEVWRLVTAITLHNDISHLSSNLLGISIFSYLSCRYMGNGLTWFLIIIAATLSNFTNDIAHIDRSFHSLGSSTAVFAALGLLTGFPIGTYFRTKEPILRRDWLIPFFGGCILFAWMGGGSGTANVDVPGHLWAFLYGLIFATLISWVALHAKLKISHQNALLAAAALLPTAAWAWALTEAMASRH